MKAIILAAGRGSRMGTLTDDQPKCFAKLRGRRLLDWQLDALHGAGINEIAIVRGYRGECFKEPVTYFNNPRWESSNMVMSLATAASWLEEETCVVSYSDIFYSDRAVGKLRDAAGELAMTYDPNWLAVWRQRFEDPLSDAETFRLNADGSVAEIGHRPQSLDEVQGQYMGLLKFTPVVWRKVSTLLATLPSEEAARMDMTTLLRRLITLGVLVMAVAIDDEWGEVDSLSDLASYHQMHT